MAAEHVGHRRPRALVRDVDQIGAGQLLVHLTHDVRLAARAEGAVAQAAAPRLRVGDQLLEAVDRHTRVDDQSQRHVSDGCDRREIAFDVVGQGREQHRIQHEGGVVREKQRMPVGRGFRDRVGADRHCRPTCSRSPPTGPALPTGAAPSAGRRCPWCCSARTARRCGSAGKDKPARTPGWSAPPGRSNTRTAVWFSTWLMPLEISDNLNCWIARVCKLLVSSIDLTKE